MMLYVPPKSYVLQQKKMNEQWYKCMFEQTKYTSIELFKKDFDLLKSKSKKELKKILSTKNIQFTKKDTLNINKLAFLLCGGKNTNIAKQKPGPAMGSKRSINNTIDKNITMNDIQFQQVTTIIKMDTFNRNDLIEYITQIRHIPIDISDEQLIDLYIFLKYKNIA